ncbi:hypothetical protein F7Q99_35830 [Streptomyces kaniharaensis]|uniref:Uncharacterized protein n=1 Tax=Streptomyces kaniharaensis TaxID=212423 RepID=A0A6N7L0P0_9ACTN|nr:MULTISPECIES: hypothetical protein [Streptomyces]MQS17412.1 hypothetical protein [Streptomyces kaniharaensis]
MASKVKVADRLRELARAVEAMDEYAQDSDAWLSPHPATRHLIERRGVSREQLNYSVPSDLDLKTRVNTYNAEHGNPGAGNVVAAALDAWLRAHGYPPVLEEADSPDQDL